MQIAPGACSGLNRVRVIDGNLLTAAGKGENGTVWSTLQTLAWCPVLAEPSAAGMPWPSTELPLLSPPKLVRSMSPA